jgi:polar amino acid transport system substrate-binding protein
MVRTFRVAAGLLVLALSLLPGRGPAAAEEPREELVSALTGKFPPFSYSNEQGELAGFDVDVSREIAQRMGCTSRIVATEWDGILAGLLAKKYDVIIASMAITPVREESVNFSTPYYHSGAQLFVHRDNPDQIYSIAECEGLPIAVVLGETYQQFLETRYPGIVVVTLKSSAAIFEMLEQKRISGFVTDRLVGAWQIKQAGRPFVPVGDMLYRERIGIAVRKEMPELLTQVNQALAGMEADGTLGKIHNRYFGLSGTQAAAPGRMPISVIALKLLKGFAVSLGVAAAAIALGFVLAIPCGLVLANPKGPWAILYFPVRLIVDVLRGTPVLIQLLFVWLGLGLSPFPAAILTLGICSMAYMAEVIRSGLMSVNPGQNIAARALGLSAVDRFRFVVWPQAFRIAIPPLMNSVVALIKDTALISIISIPELIREAQSIISVTFKPQIYYPIAGLLFFMVTFPLMKLAGRLEKSIQAKGFSND